MNDAKIRVNGQFEALVTTVSALLAAKNLEEARGVAVAVNNSVVPRSAWRTTLLSDGDVVEIVRAVGGG